MMVLTCEWDRFGYDQGVMAGLLTGDAFVRTFSEIDTTPGGNGSSSLQGTVYVILLRSLSGV